MNIPCLTSLQFNPTQDLDELTAHCKINDTHDDLCEPNFPLNRSPKLLTTATKGYYKWLIIYS